LEQQPNQRPLRQIEPGTSEPGASGPGTRGPGEDEPQASVPQPTDAVLDVVPKGASSDDIGVGLPSDWVDAQLSRIELALRVSLEPVASARLLLLDLAPLVHAVQGAAYVLERGAARLTLAAGYAAGEGLPAHVAVGEGLLGQCAASRSKLVVSGISSEHFRVRSALGASSPATLVFVPVALEAGALAVLELAVLALAPSTETLLERLAQRSALGDRAHATTETFESALIAATHRPATAATREPELATTPSVSAGGRPGFWSTLSHELRSPLNSVIVLSQVLAENVEHNLSEKQVNLARVIHGSGKDLLALVDTVSLLAKIEARRLVLSPGELELGALQRHLSRALEPLAHARGLRLSVEIEPAAPLAIFTDPGRARQIVECMLVAAIERADGPVVRLRIGERSAGWSSDRERLNGAGAVLAFAVDGTFGTAPRDAAGADGSASVARPPLEPDAPDAAEPPPLGVLARSGVLGLALGRMLAGLLGGELRQDGDSARLTLYLPAASGGPRAASESPTETPHDADEKRSRRSEPASAAVEPEHLRYSTSAAARAGELEGLELLLVDPDVRRAFTLIGHLERQGAAVAHAEDLSEVLDRLPGKRAPSAVLIDASALRASPEPSVQRLLRLAEQLPLVVLRAASEEGARWPHVHRSSRAADTREVVALLRRVAARPGSLHTRTR
jgi:signal transduction histidine kinase